MNEQQYSDPRGYNSCKSSNTVTLGVAIVMGVTLVST